MTQPLVEQLWGDALAEGRLHLRAPGRPDTDARTGAPTGDGAWRETERYYVVPTASRPTMLLPVSPRPALLGALKNYRGLRTGRRQLQRTLLSGAALAGRLPCPEVVLSVPSDEPAGSRANPLGELSAALGRPDLRAAIGVRTSANRKATLQLVDTSGTPVGFAKFSWSEQTATAVRRETSALTSLGEEGTCRWPRVLATGTYSGWPYLVTSPLPLSSRAVRGRVPAPTIQELHDLAPLTGPRDLATSAHLRSVTERLQALALVDSSAQLASRTLEMLSRAHAHGGDVLMSERWHGDLTPWNTARDSDGQLWCWDWESSELDAVAGLDAIHWHLSLVQEARGVLDAEALSRAVTAAMPVLVGFGHRRRAVPVVAAVYVAATVEKAVSLSVAEGGWEAGWLTAENLHDLISWADRQLQPQLQR